jgi:hypothetical protein
MCRWERHLRLSAIDIINRFAILQFSEMGVILSRVAKFLQSAAIEINRHRIYDTIVMAHPPHTRYDQHGGCTGG